jgi:hypothetical protein
MPYSKAQSQFSSGGTWMWPKFDKRPVGYLVFIDGFAPCIWYPDRQEGMTFRWILPPHFCQHGATVCLANILAGESVLQVEDILIDDGRDLWSSLPFSQRWKKLGEFWNKLPSDQPLLAFTPRVVSPISLEDWEANYDASQYWIIQHDTPRQPRWFWKDTVTPLKTKEFVSPKLQRSKEIIGTLCAMCRPYTKLMLPDTYMLSSQEEVQLGMGSIPTLTLSLDLRKHLAKYPDGFPVEVKWNDQFEKYEIVRILPEETPISTQSFFSEHCN